MSLLGDSTLRGGDRYQGSARLVDVPLPTIFAHRGGPLQAPEHSLEAYRIAIAQGIRMIELDVQRLADGSFGVMHDDTVDRTTTGTGNVADFTATSWKRLVLESGTWNDTVWPAAHPPLLSEVLTELGGQVVLVIEVKVAGQMAAFLDILDRLRIPKASVLVQATADADADLAVARGWTLMMLGTSSIGNNTAKGYTWIGSPSNSGGITSGATATAAHAAGQKVAAYTVTRRVERDALLAVGIDALFSDDPAYLASDAILRKTDLFAGQALIPGHQANGGTGGNDPGKFYSGGYWGWDLNAGNTNFALHGYLQPTDPTNFTLDFTIRIDAVNAGDTSRWASLYVGANDRAWTDDSNAANNGYHFLIRANGQLDVFRVNGTTKTNIGSLPSATGTDFVLGADVPMRLTVTASTVTLERLDVAEQVQVTNSEVRGRYFSFGRNSCGVRLKTLTVS